MIEVVNLIGVLTLVALALATAGIASAHAILNKRDVRSAIGWVGLIWLVPFFGSALYGLFGINRIRRRAVELRPHHPPSLAGPGRPPDADHRGALAEVLPADQRNLTAIADLVDAITPMPLTYGNRIAPLATGKDAFEAMLDAIGGASRTVGLASYIFDPDRGGELFASALGAAVRRGVEVRVLIDGVGGRTPFPKTASTLRRLGVPVAEFLPTFVPVYVPYANLRNHRKILVVDGCVGFTGGVNIRERYLRPATDDDAIRDLHFRLEGPIVAHLASVFDDDWAFSTEQSLAGDGWFPELEPAGNAAARGIAAGPDEDIERIRWTLQAALSQARFRVRIVTPYFLPDQMLAASLVMTAMRGVEVDILVPKRSNRRLVQWASMAKVGQLLAAGCRVWETPAPFDHAKIMTVDGAWSLIGSANWDERSLRLNFEFDVECYDPAFASALDGLIDARIPAARPLSLEAVNARHLAVKLRDGGAWLLSPYL